MKTEISKIFEPQFKLEVSALLDKLTAMTNIIESNF